MCFLINLFSMCNQVFFLVINMCVFRFTCKDLNAKMFYESSASKFMQNISSIKCIADLV